jgi:putative peptide zinc metalloprotease protein
MNDRALTSAPIRLAPGVELVTGPNELPLLYVSARRSYVRLGESAADLARWLVGRTATAGEISQHLAARYGLASAHGGVLVSDFLRQLDDAGALDRSDRAEIRPSRLQRVRRTLGRLASQPRLRVIAWRLDRSFFMRPLAAIRARAGSLPTVVVALLSSAAAAMTAYTYFAVDNRACPATVPLAFLATAIALHIAAHEATHALVASWHGVTIREVGIELLYYFIPVVYTDRTDSYRLADFRSRASIALAGPIFDLCAAGVTAAVACFTAGGFSNEARLLSSRLQLLMVVQILICLANINPLMPTDGYHVVEAWFGHLTFQRRAFALLFRRLTFRTPPPHLRDVSRRQELAYLAFAIASLAYVLVLAGTLVYQITHRGYLAGL